MSQPDSFGVQRSSAEGSITPAAWAELADDSLDALLTMHSGAAVPSYVEAGMEWLDTSGTPWIRYFYDGNTSIPIAKINATTHEVQHCFFKGTDIASAAALTIPGDGNVFEVTGTTAVTSIATLRIGSLIALRFAGALTLTHSTSLRLADATDITTAAGDYGLFFEYDTGKWECVSFSHNTAIPIPAAVQTELDRIDTELTDKVDDTTAVIAGTGLAGGGTLDSDPTISADIATQAEAEAGTATDVVMTPERTKDAISAFGVGAPQVILEDQKSSGTDGGTATNGGWNTHDLGTKVYDPNSVCTLASDEFTFDEDGIIEFGCVFYDTQVSQARIYNVTDGVEVKPGMIARSNTTSPSLSESHGIAEVTANKTYRLEYQTNSTRSDIGLGSAAGWTTEIYAFVKYWRK